MRRYQLKDNTAHEERGELRTFAEDHQTIVVRGSYTYVDKDGKTYTVKYVADELGYRPEGEHLPARRWRGASILLT